MNRAMNLGGYRRLLLTGALAVAAVWSGELFAQGPGAAVAPAPVSPAAVSPAPTAQAAATGLKPQAYDRQISRAVARFLIDEHLSKQQLTPQMSERAFTTFLKMLDPMKVYFMQSDVDEFSKYQDVLADNIKKGDVSFSYMVFDRFLKRIDERLKLVDELMSQPMDFTVDESMQTDPKQMSYAKDDAEMRDRWRKRLKYDLLAKKADKVADKEANDKIERRYHSLDKRMHQMTSDELLETLFDRADDELRSAYGLHVAQDGREFRH